MNKNVNYGNWVPEKMLALCYVAAAVLGIAAYVTGPVLHLAIPTWILGILAAICLVYGIYMHICHELFAFGKGNMMAKVHQHLVDHLEWDGEGTLLDIGSACAAAIKKIHAPTIIIIFFFTSCSSLFMAMYTEIAPTIATTPAMA